MSEKQKIGRNDPCPCGSGKKYKKCCGKQDTTKAIPDLSWQDSDGIHVIGKGKPPTAEELRQLTKQYQDSIRHSPLWTEMVNAHGLKKAEEILLQFEAKIGP